MKDLSIIQAYYLCAVHEKGSISGFSIEKSICFVAAGLLDLPLAGSIGIEGKMVCVTGALPSELSYLQSLYDWIVDKQPVKLGAIAEAYQISFTGKRFSVLLGTVGSSLAALEMAAVEKAGWLGNRDRYVPEEEAVASVIEMLRAELLKDGPVRDKTAVLAMLLEKGNCLKRYFSKLEQRDGKEKLRSLLDAPEGQMVKEMIAHIESILTALLASTSVCVSQ